MEVTLISATRKIGLPGNSLVFTSTRRLPNGTEKQQVRNRFQWSEEWGARQSAFPDFN